MKFNAKTWPAHPFRGVGLRLVRALLCLALTACWSASGEGDIKQEGKTATETTAIEKTWGIQIAGLRLSAAGYMVDFRYKVIDPEKAAPLAKREAKPYLVDAATGAKMLVPTSPKIGSLRQTAVKLQPGRIYGAMFSNPAKVVKSGSKVTVVIGECRLEDLLVQ